MNAQDIFKNSMPFLSDSAKPSYAALMVRQKGMVDGIGISEKGRGSYHSQPAITRGDGEEMWDCQEISWQSHIWEEGGGKGLLPPG